ncbi:MAG: hypothetical protein V4603_15535 [Pseudomonadota bacterium]
MNSLATAAEQKALLLRNFLLHGPAQQQGGDNRGAVAGTLQSNGAAHYVYGEITGYYLHWLASLPLSAAELQAPSQAAVDWLQRYLHSDGMPLTRIYLHDAVQDWRNDALFAFDLAMIAGGLARVSNRKLAVLPPPLIADLQQWLLHFLDKQGVAVCIKRTPAVDLPQRWSTSGGAFTAKTASRILMLGSQVALDAGLLQACRVELQDKAVLAGQQGIDMLHPTLYALEGCLLSPGADIEKLASWFEQISALQAADGTLPESLQTPEVRRTDVIAQALRVAIFLESLLSQPGRYQKTTDGLARALLQRVRDDGSVGFSSDGKTEANIWSGMFAEQALSLYAAHVRQQPLPFIADSVV